MPRGVYRKIKNCISCKKNTAALDRSLCSKCAEYHVEYKKSLKEKGLCLRCGQSNDRRGRFCTKCNETEKIRKRKHRITMKKQAISYLGGVCQICKKEFPLCCFDFHHLDSAEKESNIGNRLHRSWEEILPLLEKVALLCANCHRIKHNGDYGA